jgi:beta-galactosidase
LICRKLFLFFVIIIVSTTVGAQIRQDVLLNERWISAMNETDSAAYNGFEKATYPTKNWQAVNVPHNWDDYYGYRRKLHGNLHCTAWYRRNFLLAKKEVGKRYFLFFEGVGSYATVWLNGKQVGYHAGGRTTFTLDITNVVVGNNQQNILAVKAFHPSFIKDLPWVCGGCSDERGFSEGSQPIGIFRPVHFITTNDIRIEPFGVHAWNDTTVSAKSAVVHFTNTIKNYGSTERSITITNRLINKQNKTVAEVKSTQKIIAGKSFNLQQSLPEINSVELWSLDNPYLYTIETTVSESGRLLDKQTTPYGIRWISWPILKPHSSNQFYLNGKPVFINGQAEYEHMLGGSHAFSQEQIRARVGQTKAAGFNAFRDAHQPHNLLYQQLIDSVGMLWWTQFSAHIWYDSPQFREEFKKLLKDWVIERRNSPSLVLWGLQNESKLPEDFARECSGIIRSLDPTASSQRLITTCNGGTGTDWDVPQNWTGTYGGDPAKYGEDVKRQILIGEYGAWRTLGLHTEGPFVANGPLSEDRMTQLMEQKIRLAESVRDSACGQFHWLLTSHDNPGRVQGGEGYRELDRIGPVNYKGLLTPWDEPADAFYMFRSNYASKETEPMVYIVSRTWPDRWTTPGIKDSIIVYSNCDEVELFNDVDGSSLSRKKRGGIGTRFQWDKVNIQYNILKAVGYMNGNKVGEDLIVLHHLPSAPSIGKNITSSKKNLNAKSAIVRINCGGPNYTDHNGNIWQADISWDSIPNHWGSLSWTNKFAGMPPYFASQRTINDPIDETIDWQLYQSFRYGRQDLQYRIPVPNGRYKVEFYFTEPWWGTGGINATGYRIFDVAVNDKTVIKDLDIYKEVGCRTALKKTVDAEVKNGVVTISFPNVKAGQAIISAIAVFAEDKAIKPVIASQSVITSVQPSAAITKSWLNTGDTCFTNEGVTFSALPSELYGAEWLQYEKFDNRHKPSSFTLAKSADVYIAIDDTANRKATWLNNYEDTKTNIETDDRKIYHVYKKRFAKNSTLTLGENINYFVAVQPASNLEPPYDLKATTSYRPATAVLNNAVKDSVNGRESINLTDANSSLEWPIQTGVADIYSLTIRYANSTNKKLQGTLTFLGADGTVYFTEKIEFTPSPKGKWNYISTNTHSQINAGNYKVKITGAGVSISGLDVQ